MPIVIASRVVSALFLLLYSAPPSSQQEAIVEGKGKNGGMGGRLGGRGILLENKKERATDSGNGGCARKS